MSSLYTTIGSMYTTNPVTCTRVGDRPDGESDAEGSDDALLPSVVYTQ